MGLNNLLNANEYDEMPETSPLFTFKQLCPEPCMSNVCVFPLHASFCHLKA